MGKIFYENKVEHRDYATSVSETLFRTPTGTIYLIRDISSVEVKEDNDLWLGVLGLGLLAYSISNAYDYIISTSDLSAESVVSGLACLILGLVLSVLGFYTVYRSYFKLFIVVNGKRKEALSDNKEKIQKVQEALASSMSNLHSK